MVRYVEYMVYRLTLHIYFTNYLVLCKFVLIYIYMDIYNTHKYM